MYFRLKKNSCGQVLQLVEAYRNAQGKPGHRIVISLGNAAINEDERKTIAALVERRLYGYTDIFEQAQPQSIQTWVGSIVRQVDSHGKWHPLVKHSVSDPAPGDRTTTPELVVDGVLVDQVSHTNTVPVGPQLIGLHAWNALGMPQTLEQLGFNSAQQHAAAVSVINRLTDPAHEHRLGEWFAQTGLPELFEQPGGIPSDDRYYRVSDRLLASKEKIEHHLQRQQQALYDLDRTILLYDLTNTHFEGTAAGNPKAKRGHNKQKRDDCPQITVGMVFDQNGFELAHRVFEGNKSDSKSVVDMVGDLEKLVERETLFSAQKPLVIMDAGIATRQNLDLLKKKGFSYLVNDSRRGRKNYAERFKEEGFVVVQNREKKEPVEIKSIEQTHTVSDKKDEEDCSYTERLLLCRSASRGEKEAAIFSQAEKKFIEAVDKLSKRVAEGKLIDKEKILRSIGRIQQRHPRVQRYYTIECCFCSEPEHGAPLAPSIKSQRNDALCKEKDLLNGCYVLRTDRLTLTDQQIWQVYMTLTKAEDGFRALKSDLGLRPNPHHRENRVDGHVFISVLAYQLLRYITFGLEKHGDTRTWGSIRRVLQTHCYTTIILPTKNGTVYRIRKAGEPEECQKAIYRMLQIDWRNLPVIKQIVQQKNNSTL